MIREVLSHELLALGTAFKKQGDVVSAMDCALKVLKLDPDSAEAYRLVQDACRQQPRGQADPEHLRHLKSRKIQLISHIRGNPCLAEQLGFESSFEPKEAGNPAAAPEIDSNLLHQRLSTIRKRLTGRQFAEARRVRERLEALLASFNLPSTPPADAEAGQRVEYDDYGELSLEHQVHDLGNDFYRVGRFEDACECFGIAVGLRSDLLESYFNRSLCYTRLGRYEAARDDLTHVIEINGNLSEAFYTRALGGVSSELGRCHRGLPTSVEGRSTVPQSRRAPCGSAKTEGGGCGGRARGEDRGCLDENVGRRQGDRIKDFSIYREKPAVRFSDVYLPRIIPQFEMIAAFLKGDPAFEEWGCDPPRGVILYAPPGTGKTHLARALAGEINCPFYNTPSTVFLNLWYGSRDRCQSARRGRLHAQHSTRFSGPGRFQAVPPLREHGPHRQSSA